MTCGLVLGTSTMTSFSFRAFGLAMLPYIGWNYWFGGIGPGRGMVTSLMWMDFLGNVFFCAGSFYCAGLLQEQEEEDQKEREKKE